MSTLGYIFCQAMLVFLFIAGMILLRVYIDPITKAVLVAMFLISAVTNAFREEFLEQKAKIMENHRKRMKQKQCNKIHALKKKKAEIDAQLRKAQEQKQEDRMNEINSEYIALIKEVRQYVKH